MPQHLLFEGPDLEVLLAQVRAEHGHDARIVKAERVRTGGVGGFFAKEKYELTVAVESGPASGWGAVRESGDPRISPAPAAAGRRAPEPQRPEWADPGATSGASDGSSRAGAEHDDIFALLARADAADTAAAAPQAAMTGPDQVTARPPRPPVTSAPRDYPDPPERSPVPAQQRSQVPDQTLASPVPRRRLSTERSAFDQILMSVRAQLGGTDPVPVSELPASRVMTGAGSAQTPWRPEQLRPEPVRPDDDRPVSDIVAGIMARVEGASRGYDDVEEVVDLVELGDPVDVLVDIDRNTVVDRLHVRPVDPPTAAGPPPTVPAAPVAPPATPQSVPSQAGPADVDLKSPATVPAEAATAPVTPSATPWLDAILKRLPDASAIPPAPDAPVPDSAVAGVSAAATPDLDAGATSTALPGSRPAQPDQVDTVALASALSLSGLSPTVSAELAEQAAAAGPLAPEAVTVLAARHLAGNLRLPSEPGDVVVVAGPAPGLATAAAAVAEFLAVDAAQLLVLGELPGDTSCRPISVADVPAAVAAAASVMSPLVIAVVTPETVIGARRTARIVSAVSARVIVGVWDCARDAYDAQRWLATMAGSSADVVSTLALTGCDDAGSVAAVATAGCDVVLLDGRPASVGAWAALLVDRLDQIIGYGARHPARIATPRS